MESLEAVLQEAGEFESLLNEVDASLDHKILQLDGSEGEAKEQAINVFKEFDRRRRAVSGLEGAILSCKEDIRLEKNQMNINRDKVKMTQAELSCLTLEVHALEQQRHRVLHEQVPALEERRERDSLQESLITLQQQNACYPRQLAELNKRTSELEALIKKETATDDTYISLLKDRCISTGQELHQRLANEEEWAELKLVTEEKKAEINALHEKLLSYGAVLPKSAKIERIRHETSKRVKKPNCEVSKYFVIPAGTLRPLVTIQGYGLQGIRTKYNVSIDIELGEGWCSNIISIRGLESSVEEAKVAIETLCNSVLTPRPEALLTYPRSPSSRVGPIPTPWAKMQRQRAEVDCS
eukprot:TRINITY_DN16671_c0_g1_i1.p1 TRINITY_DN16671_c0_g1~~TRINITY_DN16671_c0_g1_i1.p1  ORF type:complete len:368 (+),score=79.60 TRINITY_DN16671_c0_g1_i1:44-1105(+)